MEGMRQIGPGEARVLFDFLLPQVRSELAVTEKILAAVPVGREDYQPGDKAMSAFALARHIAICDLWFLDAVLNGQFEEDATRPPESAITCREIAAWYGEKMRSRIQLLESLSDADLAREIDYIGLRHDPAVAYLNIAIRHTAHHRGQMSAYLRGMGAKVPAIYVESADEPYPSEDGSEVVPPAF